MMVIKTHHHRNEWLKTLYKYDILRADEVSLHLADKLWAANTLKSYLKQNFEDFHPRTMGLKAFYQNIKMNTLADLNAAVIESELQKAFPHGVILKPAAVINTGGETAEYVFNSADVAKVLSVDSTFSRSGLSQDAYTSPLLGKTISGEEYILQDDVAGLAGRSTQRAKAHQEIRIHTFENKVLPGGSYSRWKVNEIQDRKKFHVAEDLVQNFLNLLPTDFLQGQAWGLDVLVFDNGSARIIDINTNRGQKVQWTGYLSRPSVLGAYTRHIEKTKNVHFEGWNGFLLRNNLGNTLKFLKKYYIEGIR